MRNNGTRFGRVAVAVALAAVCGSAVAQTSVAYGRVTAVNMITQESARAQRTGALIGGGIGLATGSGQSGSNRALRTVGGGFAGQQIGRLTSNRQAFEYTVLLGGTSTITMITDEGGMRVGDCVAVERGSFNNLRLVDDARCAPPRAAAAPASAPAKAPPPPPAASRDAVRQAESCITAKDQLLAAETDDAFDRAERRVRLLCGD